MRVLIPKLKKNNMKNVIMLGLVLLSFTACNTTQFDLDLFEQIENPQPDFIDQNFFEKGSNGNIKIVKEDLKGFDCELNPPIVNGGYEVEFTYHWEYYRTQGDVLSKKTSSSFCPRISTFRGGQISCKFQARRVGTNIKSDFKTVYIKY